MNLEELKTMYDFTGRTFFVTGGTSVLCGPMAWALAGCNAQVVTLERKVTPAEGLVERKGPDGTYIHAVGGDVLDLASLRRAYGVTMERFGKVDGLINGAGGNKPEATASPDKSFFDLPADALRWVFDLNIVGTILPCQVFGKGMAERGEGVILNISSMNAFRPLTRIAAYSAAKAGINNFTQWLAVHMAQNYSGKIRVNAIAPGFFLTKQNEYLMKDEATGDWTPRGQSIISHTPMGRLGTPEDLLGATLGLLSPAAAFVTGIVVPIDGGFSAYSGV